VRVTLETDSWYKFVFFVKNCEEMVRCFYPDGERETITLNHFVKVLHAERRKRAKAARDMRAYRERNK